MTRIERALEVSGTVARAEAGRMRAWEAIRKMRRRPTSFKAVRDYVAASTIVEEAELALQKMKREIAP